jgi:hypothetical protein
MLGGGGRNRFVIDEAQVASGDRLAGDEQVGKLLIYRQGRGCLRRGHGVRMSGRREQRASRHEPHNACCNRDRSNAASPPTNHGSNLAGRLPAQPFARTVNAMLTVIVILLVAWAVLAVVGFAVKGLLWLAIIGIILFIGTLVFGFVRRSARRKSV